MLTHIFFCGMYRAGCAIVYLILGLMCFDRFTSKAFLSTHDPVASTAIPPSSGIQVSSSAHDGAPIETQVPHGRPQAYLELV